MSAVEVIERMQALPKEERAKVARFLIEHEESWIPAEFREAMDQAAQGKMVDMERVMAARSLPAPDGLSLRSYGKFWADFRLSGGLQDPPERVTLPKASLACT